MLPPLPQVLGPLSAMETGPDGDLPHFAEHFHNVKRHHEQLQQRMVEMGGADTTAASRSLLFSNLR